MRKMLFLWRITYASLPVFLIIQVSLFGKDSKQRIIVLLKEPLQEENVLLKLKEIKTSNGEIKDFETLLALAPEKKSLPVYKEQVQKHPLLRYLPGNGGGMVELNLEKNAFVELILRDTDGKTIATLFNGPLSQGFYPFALNATSSSDNNGVCFLVLKLDGNMTLRQTVYKLK